MSTHDDHSNQQVAARGKATASTQEHDGDPARYLRFGLMILTSSAVMYVVMYFNTYSFDHVYWSWTRFFMTMMSAATMTAIMLLFMLGMYKDRRVNAAILAFAMVLFGSGLYLVRSQSTIGDVAWMKAMIPHHSIAILTSERANIEDPRVRQLADSIIEAQRREIEEMQTYIKDLEGR